MDKIPTATKVVRFKIRVIEYYENYEGDYDVYKIRQLTIFGFTVMEVLYIKAPIKDYKNY